MSARKLAPEFIPTTGFQDLTDLVTALTGSIFCSSLYLLPQKMWWWSSTDLVATGAVVSPVALGSWGSNLALGKHKELSQQGFFSWCGSCTEGLVPSFRDMVGGGIHLVPCTRQW